MSSKAAREILVRGARALAHADPLGPSLGIMLGVLAETLDIESTVIVVPDGPDRVVIVASIGLGDPARPASRDKDRGATREPGRGNMAQRPWARIDSPFTLPRRRTRYSGFGPTSTGSRSGSVA